MPTTTLPLPRSKTPAIDIYIRLAHYPVLADKIRARMRHELFSRGIIDEIVFEAQVREKAIESQRRERLTDPYGQEDTHIWQKRKARVRDFQTDALFADNLGSVLLDQIIQEVLLNQPSPSVSSGLNFNRRYLPGKYFSVKGKFTSSYPKMSSNAASIIWRRSRSC